MCKPSVSYLWKNIKTNEADKSILSRVCVHFTLQINKTHVLRAWGHKQRGLAVLMWPTWLVLQVVEAFAPLYDLGDVLLHHIDHLINLRLHPDKLVRDKESNDVNQTNLLMILFQRPAQHKAPVFPLISFSLYQAQCSWLTIKKPVKRLSLTVTRSAAVEYLQNYAPILILFKLLIPEPGSGPH